jgi:hypothetical protein
MWKFKDMQIFVIKLNFVVETRLCSFESLNILIYTFNFYGSRDSAVGIATSYGLDDRGVGVRVPVVSRIFSSPDRPDRIWGPPNLLSNV